MAENINEKSEYFNGEINFKFGKPFLYGLGTGTFVHYLISKSQFTSFVRSTLFLFHLEPWQLLGSMLSSGLLFQGFDHFDNVLEKEIRLKKLNFIKKRQSRYLGEKDENKTQAMYDEIIKEFEREGGLKP